MGRLYFNERMLRDVGLDAPMISTLRKLTEFVETQEALEAAEAEITTQGDAIDAANTAIDALEARNINTTAPLEGGGDLSADRTLSLADTAVTPASYTNTDLTVDAKGRITAAANGTVPSGTVTSVGLSAPTGFSVGGSPVTSSGTLAIAFDTGYSLPTDASQANWDTAFGWGDHASAGYVSTSRALTAGVGLTGGGDLSADRTFTVGAGTGITVNADDVALDTSSTRNTDHSGVTLTAGDGLTGGGDITANRSFAVGAGIGIIVNANDVAIADTAVVPGSYLNTNLTVDAKGRITAAEDGETPPTKIYDFTAGSLPAGATLERATTGTYRDTASDIETAAIDTARFEFDNTIRLEEERENELTQSEDFSVWTGTAITVTTNTHTAPDGASTADTLAANTTGTVRRFRANSVTVGQLQVFSVFLKAISGVSWIALTSDTGGARCYFDIENGALGALGAGNDASGIEDYGNGWYRCWVAYEAGATDASNNNFIYFVDSNGALSFTGSGSLAAWGAQAETGTFPTSYISTAGSTVTRSTDELNIDLPDGIYGIKVTYDDDSTQEFGEAATGSNGLDIPIADFTRTNVKTIAVSVGVGTILAGGTTGQVLTKKSNDDYDFEWATP